MPKRDISTDPVNLKAMWRKAQTVYNELKSSGLSDIAIAAILGNIAQESAFDPNAGAGSYSGYIQNQKEIVNWIKKNFGGYAHSHLMKYLLAGLANKLPETTSLWGKELNKRFNDFIKGLTNATTVEQATKLWESSYEKSRGLLLLKRINYANYFYKLILNNKNKNKQSKLTEETNLTLNNLYNLLFPEYISQNEEPQKSIDEVKTDFDLPLLATAFRNGGKLIKRHQYGGTLASRYIQRYFDPNNPLLTYVNFGDAQKAGVLFTNDINNPESGWYFSYDIAKDLQGKDENSREFRNNIGGHIINPATTYAAVDQYGRIINNKDFNVIVNGESLIPTSGYVFDETRGWVPGLPTSNGQIIDLDMLDLAEQASRFLSDRGFEHAWRMDPIERIKFARSVQESDAAGYATVFGSQIPKAATSAYNWLTGTNAGRAFTSSMLAGEAIDAGSRAITGLSYGDYMASQYGGNPFLWGLTNPGYLAGEGLVTPLKETLEPAIKETSKALTERIILAGKNLFNRDFKGQLDYAFEETAIPSSSDLKTKIEAATKYINYRLSKGYKNSKIYTPEEATLIQDLLAAEGIDIKATDNATLIGHTPSKNTMNSIMHRLLNYRLFNFYEPVLPFDNTIKDGKLIDFRIPKQTYFVLDENGNLVLTTTRSGKLYSDDIIEWPTFLADFPKRNLRGLFLSNGGSRVAFNFVPLLKPFAIKAASSTTRHEVFGHGMNDIAKAVMDKETATPYLSELYKILNGLNPEVLKSMKQFFSPKMNERELQALLKLTWDPIIRDIGRLEGISPQQMEYLSKNNIEKLQALFEQYVDNATPQQLYIWLESAGSSYASFVKRLLPVEKGLADAIENNVDTYDLLLDMVVDNLRRKKVSYTTEDANKFMLEIKHVLKKGFSVALPASVTIQKANEQNS